MRTTERTTLFRRDFKRLDKGRFSAILATDFWVIVETLAKDEPLPAALRDHPLTGEWKNYRDCHIKPDLVLIYEKPDQNTLRLIRLGSHSQLGL